MIEKIKVYTDHLEIRLKVGIDCLLRRGTLCPGASLPAISSALPHHSGENGNTPSMTQKCQRR